MYYAVSRMYSNFSAIGLATSRTGLPGTWKDRGRPVISSPPPPSYAGPEYNALDPSLLVDANGRWWLVFGSFAGGIFMQQLNPLTGELLDPKSFPVQIATRPGLPEDAIEEPFIYQHGGVYYLFVSFDYCCSGAASSYSIHVGRSVAPTGPYVDEAGRPLLEGGGTTVLASHDYVVGPGGSSVVADDSPGHHDVSLPRQSRFAGHYLPALRSNFIGWDPEGSPFESLVYHDILVYHYLDARRRYFPVLGLNFLGWDEKGFPYVY
jgi:arabinan endo-1,5-alpha-L-arabinosidase